MSNMNTNVNIDRTEATDTSSNASQNHVHIVLTNANNFYKKLFIPDVWLEMANLSEDERKFYKSLPNSVAIVAIDIDKVFDIECEDYYLDGKITFDGVPVICLPSTKKYPNGDLYSIHDSRVHEQLKKYLERYYRLADIKTGDFIHKN